MYHYIGIDVSKKVIHVFNGKNYLIFKNEMLLHDFSEWLVESYTSFENLVLIFEPTGSYSENLRYFASSNNIRCAIVNPKKSSNFSKTIGNRIKNDRIDAKMLYKYNVLLSPKDIMVPIVDKFASQIRAYIASYEFTVKERVAAYNHLESIKYLYPDNTKLFLRMKSHCTDLDDMENEFLDILEEYILNTPELKNDYNNLRTIPGIGKMSSIYLLVFFRTYPDANRQQITALAGLDVTERTSGSSVSSRRKISKCGNSRVRNILYFPAISAIRFNPVIKSFYERLISRNKKKKVVIIASMRKLLLISFAIFKNNSKFSIDF